MTITKNKGKNLIKSDNGKAMRKGTKFTSVNCFHIQASTIKKCINSSSKKSIKDLSPIKKSILSTNK